MPPEMDGWDATLQIRALPGPRVFIVALTQLMSRAKIENDASRLGWIVEWSRSRFN